MPDCTSCQFFELETTGKMNSHVNRPGGLAITQQALNYCNFPRNSRILDVACGSSTTLNYLTYQKKLSAIGVDLSFGMLEKGRTQHPGLAYVQADGVSIPFVDRSCDAIIVECALSLSGKAEEAIGEFRRVLRSGGKLIITDIFIRELNDASGLDCLAATHCLAGIMTEESISRILTSYGFFQKFWQDHTNELKQWMAEMVFKLGSLKALYHLLGFREERSGSPSDLLGRTIKLGYYLLVAEKTG